MRRGSERSIAALSACRCATSSGELDSAERPLRRRLPIPRPSMRTPPTDRSSRMSGASREPSQLPRAWELANTRQPLYPPFIGSSCCSGEPAMLLLSVGALVEVEHEDSNLDGRDHRPTWWFRTLGVRR